MRPDEAPVADDELVLRLIHPSYYCADLELRIQPEAFRPTDHDQDGISVLRAAFATPAQSLLLVREDKRRIYYVVRLAVRDLRRLHLSVRPDPMEEVVGHAVIPELNTADYRANKTAWKLVQRELAELASRDLVHSPTTAP